MGIGGRGDDVYTVHHKGLCAVVSNTPLVVYDPTRENVFAHEQVNETVMREFTVIPMSFGTLFRTEEDIVELLKSTYQAFDDVLEKMKDKIEFGLKVLWDRDHIIREIEEEDEDIRRLKGEISSQKGSTYFARMQYGRLIDAALQARTPLWFYVLAEAQKPLVDLWLAQGKAPLSDEQLLGTAAGSNESPGVRLGEVGGRIVAEVFYGVLDNDPTSFRAAPATWAPLIMRGGQRCSMWSLLMFAGLPA